MQNRIITVCEFNSIYTCRSPYKGTKSLLRLQKIHSRCSASTISVTIGIRGPSASRCDGRWGRRGLPPRAARWPGRCGDVGHLHPTDCAHSSLLAGHSAQWHSKSNGNAVQTRDCPPRTGGAHATRHRPCGLCALCDRIRRWRYYLRNPHTRAQESKSPVWGGIVGCSWSCTAAFGREKPTDDGDAVSSVMQMGESKGADRGVSPAPTARDESASMATSSIWLPYLRRPRGRKPR